MRGRHLVCVLLAAVSCWPASSASAQNFPVRRLPDTTHRIPGKHYRTDARVARTSARPRRNAPGTLPSIAFLFQPQNGQPENSLLPDADSVLPGYEYLKGVQTSPKENHGTTGKPASPISPAPKPAIRVNTNSDARPVESNPVPARQFSAQDTRSFFQRPDESIQSVDQLPSQSTQSGVVEDRTPASNDPTAPSSNDDAIPQSPLQPGLIGPQGTSTDRHEVPDFEPTNAASDTPLQEEQGSSNSTDDRVQEPASSTIPESERLIGQDDLLPGFEHLKPRNENSTAGPEFPSPAKIQEGETTPAVSSPELETVVPPPPLSPAESAAPSAQPNSIQPPSHSTPERNRLHRNHVGTPNIDNVHSNDQAIGGHDDDDGDENGGEEDDSDESDSKVDPHLELLSKNMYPSAKECGKCHESHYREWSVSAHAYASLSPMFQKFEQTINDLSKGTIGYFCMRCHAPVATSICESRADPLWESIPAANEGVTCIACHRVIERYFKVNGERRIEKGSLFEPVVASSNQNKLHEIIAKKDHYKVKTSPDDKGAGQSIHNDVVCFEQLSSSHFCVSCHQVAVYPGIKLEIVWDQYRASPACKQGISCQDCHMGAVPGKAEGYETGPTAIVGGKEINKHRKHANHMFYGPGYSIAHPGTFPINPKAEDWTVKEWLDFDWRAGWGTEEFEDMLDEGKISVKFPEVWQEVDDRMDARDIINDNLQLLAEKKHSRFELMEHSSKVEGPYFTHAPKVGKSLKFRYRVKNLNNGHNMPSGSLGAQPQVWLNVVLTGPHGNRLWESGYVDANGDVADVHSLEVAAGRTPRDRQLFNLQTKFLTTGVKGTDREMYLPINVDIDQLPFIRPSGLPITNLNHPPFIRLENHSLPPLGERNAKYRVPAKFMKTPGRYRLSVRMRSRAEPIYFMRFCKATPEMERSMNERMLDFHQHAYEFVVQ